MASPARPKCTSAGCNFMRHTAQPQHTACCAACSRAPGQHGPLCQRQTAGGAGGPAPTAQKPSAGVEQSNEVQRRKDHTAQNTAAEGRVESMDGLYEIEPGHAPGMRINVVGAGKANGTKLDIQKSNDSAAQKFKMHRIYIGSTVPFYAFEPLCAPGTAIDNCSSGKVQCHIWDNENLSNDNQHFKMEPSSAGYFSLIGRTAGGMRWDVAGSGTKPGTKLLTWPSEKGNDNNNNRQFKFIRVKNWLERNFEADHENEDPMKALGFMRMQQHK